MNTSEKSDFLIIPIKERVANMAQKTQNLGLEVFDFATDSTPAFVNGVAGLEDSNMHKIDEAIANKVKIGGENVQNVNFIRNEIVKDGLLYNKQRITSRTNTGVALGENFSIGVVISSASKTDNQYYLGNYQNSIGMYLFCNSGVLKLVYNAISLNTISLEIGKFYDVIVECVNGVLSIYVENRKYTHNQIYASNSNQLVLGGYSVIAGELMGAKLINSFVYNRQLNSQEIQHNLSILNNTPSINRINDYAISTDTDHIQDRTGRTTEQINRVFYKNMCKEFTSSGTDIVVNNGMDGYVLSGAITGNTVKNYALTFNLQNAISGSYEQIGDYVRNTGSGSSFYLKHGGMIEPNKKYKAVVFVKENTLATVFRILDGNAKGCFAESWTLSTGQTGVFEKIVTAKSDLIGCEHTFRTWFSGETGFVTYSCILIDENAVVPKQYIPFGLSSTQATITNNGMKYSFYSNLEDKASGTVIDLGGLEGARNTWEIKEDGSGIYTQNVNKGTFDGSGNWVLSQTLTNCIRFGLTSNLGGVYAALILCNYFEWYTGADDKEGVKLDSVGNNIFITISKSKLTTQDVTGFKAWLKANPVTIVYRLATLVITHIPKEIVPTILTQLQNEFKFGDAVAPSKVTIQAPVNRIAEMQAQLDEIKALIQTPSNINLTMNYIEDEYNKNQSEEGAI